MGFHERDNLEAVLTETRSADGKLWLSQGNLSHARLERLLSGWVKVSVQNVSRYR